MKVANSFVGMGRGFSTFAFSLLVIAGLVMPVSLTAQERDVTQNPLAGSQVFGSKGCVKCHAINGLGAEIGPDLGRISQRHSFYELAATMWNHLPAMGAAMREYGIERPELTAEEAGDLIAFLFTLDYFDPPGDVERGKRLFVEKKCVVCHQVGTYGGVVGPSLDHLSQYGSPILVAAAMWNHGPAMAEMMEERGIDRPTFSGTELNDLIAYLESVGPAPLEGPLYVLPGAAEEGRVVFVEKNCIECHSVQGVGGRVGPDLAKRSYQWGLTEFAAAMWNKAPDMMQVMRQRDIDVPQLGAGEMADLVAYLYSVQYFAESGDAEEGRVALRTRGCLACHSLGGRGAGETSDLQGNFQMESSAEVIATLWNHATLMEGEGAEPWPILTAKDIADISAFMQKNAEDR
ncbi:MAG: cytochrome c [Gemmatimonadetes bacterium]|uniref:Cytochrome c n=1 Tax=Candidatus Kutchimonas denitrificans TaxID=3056748 RepID=A0AAE4ZD96_9BACT|nr:cytochrome c [Gemmatimonadota bacterium]NIR76105.1 cytochrome c [Candidatus Kutchimonas denitrificans]NIS00484.1 cytochrome c [Gemmatimonadota bacterium]NIT66142.1 cytochrome c [Gemmatimonadota bacterium]NIU54220.1 c-type cytochrome [Gemmatimonadota bacterium]